MFLYKEDFAHFMEGLEDVISYIKGQLGEIEERRGREPEANLEEEAAAFVAGESAKEETEEKPRRGLFGRFKKD